MAQHKRTPADPPDLPGFTFERHLGSGGFSDVYLYQQHLPRRRVAVKVLLGGDELGDTSRQALIGEANVMAQMSSHPYIVTIFHADVASDGRPFFVMEYASGRSLAERYKTERIPIDEVLRTGVRIASAVATAHSVGVLHRDIKPANILTNDFGWPALTDFGISSAVDDELADAAEGGSASTSSAGMSVPWSPPEMFDDDPQPDVRSEVFSLGATVYTLVAGHTPFEVPGGKNGTIDLIGRIERGAITPVSRRDAPRALVSVLHKAMSRRPEHRYASAVEFARALQRVELELGFAPTGIDVPNLNVAAPVRRASGVTDDAETSLRNVPVIEAQSPAALPRVPARAAAGAPGPTAGGPGHAVIHGGQRSTEAERTETRGMLRVAAQGGDTTATRGAPRAIDPAGHAGDPRATRAAATLPPTAPPTTPPASGAPGGWNAPSPAAGSRPVDFDEPALPPLGGGEAAAPAPVFERQRADAIELPEDTGDAPTRGSRRPSGRGVAGAPSTRGDRSRGDTDNPYAEAPKPKNQNLLIGILSGVIVLLLVAASIVGWIFFTDAGGADAGPTGTPGQVVPDGDYPPTPTAPTATRSENGMITFTWMNPDEQSGDVYFWRLSDGTGPMTSTGDKFATVGPYAPDARVCIDVEIRRGGLVSPEPLKACYPK